MVNERAEEPVAVRFYDWEVHTLLRALCMASHDLTASSGSYMVDGCMGETPCHVDNSHAVQLIEQQIDLVLRLTGLPRPKVDPRKVRDAVGVG